MQHSLGSRSECQTSYYQQPVSHKNIGKKKPSCSQDLQQLDSMWQVMESFPAMHITLLVLTPQYISPFKSFSTVLKGSRVARCCKLLFYENLSSEHLAQSACIRLFESLSLDRNLSTGKGSKIRSLLRTASTFPRHGIRCPEEWGQFIQNSKFWHLN